MKLKKLLEGFAWERKPGQPLPTLKDTTKAHSLKEADRPEMGTEGQFDYEYFEKQVESVPELNWKGKYILSEKEMRKYWIKQRVEENTTLRKKLANADEVEFYSIMKFKDKLICIIL